MQIFSIYKTCAKSTHFFFYLSLHLTSSPHDQYSEDYVQPSPCHCDINNFYLCSVVLLNLVICMEIISYLCSPLWLPLNILWLSASFLRGRIKIANITSDVGSFNRFTYGIVMFSVLFSILLLFLPIVTEHVTNRCTKVTFLASRCFSWVLITTSEPIMYAKLWVCFFYGFLHFLN